MGNAFNVQGNPLRGCNVCLPSSEKLHFFGKTWNKIGSRPNFIYASVNLLGPVKRHSAICSLGLGGRNRSRSKVRRKVGPF